MIIECVTKDLLEASKAVRSIFAKGPSDKDNNQDCLIASSDGSVVLESANQGLHTKFKILADVSEEGRVVLHRDSLANLKLRSEKTTFRFKDGSGQMSFKSGQLKGAFNVSQNFDEIEAQRPVSVPKISVKTPCEVLRHGIKRVMFNPTTDEANPSLRIQLSFKEKNLVITANDAYRAAVFKTQIEEKVDMPAVIVPASFFANVISAIQKNSIVGIGTNGKVIRIKGEGVDVCHPVLQSPEGKDIEPVDMEERITAIEEKESPPVEFLMDVSEAMEAISGAASIVPASSSKSHLTVTISKGHAITKVVSQVGNAEARFHLKAIVSSENIPIALDSKYILEFLNLLKTGDAVVRIWDNVVILRSEEYGTTLVMSTLNPDEGDDDGGDDD